MNYWITVKKFAKEFIAAGIITEAMVQSIASHWNIVINQFDAQLIVFTVAFLLGAIRAGNNWLVHHKKPRIREIKLG